MPELPEVETIKRRLEQVIVDQPVMRVLVLHQKSFVGDPSLLEKQQIAMVNRRAKILHLHLSNGQNLLVHLKMTGQLIYVHGDQRIGGGHPSEAWVADLPSKHTRVVIEFQNGGSLFFNDLRLFGWLWLATDAQVAEAFGRLGPDIIDSALTDEIFYAILQRRSQPIKQVMMDSSVIGGVGNIYAADALNKAKIFPFRPAKSLSKKEASRLLSATREVMERAIKLGGTTFDGHYVNVDGLAGGYQHESLVYGREGEPCKNCGEKIQKKKLGGRGTYFCGQCQV